MFGLEEELQDEITSLKKQNEELRCSFGKGSNLLFNQEESDKALLADKRVRKMFFESFRKDFEMAQKKTNEYDFNKWFNQKLKELE